METSAKARLEKVEDDYFEMKVNEYYRQQELERQRDILEALAEEGAFSYYIYDEYGLDPVYVKTCDECKDHFPIEYFTFDESKPDCLNECCRPCEQVRRYTYVDPADGVRKLKDPNVY